MNTTRRGYGNRHQKLRKQLTPQVQAGQATCWRCGKKIQPTAQWDLGHDDNDRTQYRGPEHVSCNRSAGARAKHKTPQQTPQPDTTRRW